MTRPGGDGPDDRADKSEDEQTPDEAAAEVAEQAGTVSPTSAQAQQDIEPSD